MTNDPTARFTMNQAISTDGVITQTLLSENQGLIQMYTEELSRWICNTREKMFRDAMTTLGWTPPQDFEGE